MLHTALAVAAGLIAVAFAMSTWERWLAGGRKHELVWSLALAFFATAAFALAAGAAFGWNEASFKVFYLFGAIVNVPFLALGTVYLLAGERVGDRLFVVVALVAAFGAGVVAASPLTRALPGDRLVQGSEVFTALPRVLAALCSSIPAFVIFAGAVWSAARYRRGRRLWSNVLIALGTIVLSSSGLFNSVLGEMDAFAVSLALGITIIFTGFLVATGGAPHARLRVVPKPSTRGAAASHQHRAATPRQR